MTHQASIRAVLWAILGIALLAGTARAEEFSGRVVHVADGVTITVLRDGAEAKIRLHGIDCPESKQAFGQKAKEFTLSQSAGKDVTVRVRDTDRYGRLVGEVILPDGASLNHELVRAGLAWWYRQYAPSDSALESLEAEAREAKRGLWIDPKPIPPWEFRKAKRAGKEPLPEPEPTTAPPSGVCCKTCRKGKACGDSCISRSATCSRPAGCACDGE